MADHYGLIAYAHECDGTPFKHQGRVKGRGMDCAGLLAYCLGKAGLPYIDENGYSRNPFDGTLERALDAQPAMGRIPVEEMAPGDVLLMRVTKSPQHIGIHAGIIDGHPFIVHASEMHGGVVTHRLDGDWGGRVMRVYRVRSPE